jgi:hypothetical protein
MRVVEVAVHITKAAEQAEQVGAAQDQKVQ